VYREEDAQVDAELQMTKTKQSSHASRLADAAMAMQAAQADQAAADKEMQAAAASAAAADEAASQAQAENEAKATTAAAAHAAHEAASTEHEAAKQAAAASLPSEAGSVTASISSHIKALSETARQQEQEKMLKKCKARAVITAQTEEQRTEALARTLEAGATSATEKQAAIGKRQAMLEKLLDEQKEANDRCEVAAELAGEKAGHELEMVAHSVVEVVARGVGHDSPMSEAIRDAAAASKIAAEQAAGFSQADSNAAQRLKAVQMADGIKLKQAVTHAVEAQVRVSPHCRTETELPVDAVCVPDARARGRRSAGGTCPNSS
jgi:chromosome segregation ATPase